LLSDSTQSSRAPGAALTTTFALTPVKMGGTVSIALWGTVLGVLSAGVLGETLGGRGALRIMADLYLSQGSVVCAYIGEIFPTRAWPRGQSIGSSAHWITNGLIAAVVPMVAAHSNAYAFVFNSAKMALQFALVLLLFPETKGVTLEQLQVNIGIW
jgi:hypothetical protein